MAALTEAVQQAKSSRGETADVHELPKKTAKKRPATKLTAKKTTKKMTTADSPAAPDATPPGDAAGHWCCAPAPRPPSRAGAHGVPWIELLAQGFTASRRVHSWRCSSCAHSADQPSWRSPGPGYGPVSAPGRTTPVAGERSRPRLGCKRAHA